MAKIYLDNSRYMEFIDEIATQMTEIIFLEETYASSSEVGQEDVMMFTEGAQDYYNEKYDEIETLLNNLLGVYSNNHSDHASKETLDSFTMQTMHHYLDKLKNMKL